jgi:hypothetical protein
MLGPNAADQSSEISSLHHCNTSSTADPWSVKAPLNKPGMEVKGLHRADVATVTLVIGLPEAEPQEYAFPPVHAVPSPEQVQELDTVTVKFVQVASVLGASASAAASIPLQAEHCPPTNPLQSANPPPFMAPYCAAARAALDISVAR